MSDEIVVASNGGGVPQRMSNGQFAPGNPGRPKGATNARTRLVKDAISNALNRQLMAQDEHGNLGPVYDDEGNPVRVLDKIVSSMADNAMEGDAQSFALLLQYFIGRPRQAPEDKSEDPMEVMRQVLKVVQQSENSGFRPVDNSDIGDNTSE